MLQTTDRQTTDHATERCIVIGGIAWVTYRTIPPNDIIMHV